MQPPEPPNFIPNTTPPKSKWPLGKKPTILIGLGLIVVILIVILIVSFMQTGTKTNKAQNTQITGSAFYDRDGYDRKKLPGSIGDPAPLVAQPVSTPITYAGQSVIQACNLLTLSDLKQSDLLLFPTTVSGPDRHYFDGKGKATLPAANQYSAMPASEDGNNCHYTLNDSSGIMIGLFQPFYSPATPAAFLNETNRAYQPQPDVNGSKVFADRSDSTLHNYMIQNGDTFVQITFLAIPGKDPEQNAAKVIDLVTKNLANQLNHPTGPAKTVYDSPLFKQAYVNGCDLTDNSDFKSVFGVDASPLAKEQLSSAIGAVQFKRETGDPTYFNYIHTECIRESVKGDARAGGVSGITVDQHFLTVRTDSFNAEKGAQNSFQGDLHRGRSLAEVPSKIGDESIFATIDRSDPSLFFRKGRHVISISMYRGSRLSASQMVEKLMPVAKKLASALPE